MPSFCAVFNCSNRADREKGNSNYRFPSVVKNNGKEVLKFSRVRREERLARKSKNKNQNYSFCLPFIGFLTQSSILTVIELGPQVSESPTNITNFYDPTNFEHKFHEMRT